MKKIFTLLSLVVFALNLRAQSTLSATPSAQAFGKIDTADLEMKSCNFEKDANAEVLFDRAEVAYKYSTIIMQRHKRVKIFNDNGKDEANIRIEYYGAHNDEKIVDIEAETINLNKKIIEYTAIDKKLIYTQRIDKETQAIIFTLPNVKPGSVIEFKYKLITPKGYNYPNWFFQSLIPIRYSEFDASFINDFRFGFFIKVHQPFVKDTSTAQSNSGGTRHIWALSNIKSYAPEPFMDYPEDYLQCVLLKIKRTDRNWMKVGNDMLNDEDFGDQLKKKLNNEEQIVARANTFKSDEERLSFIFNIVKDTMQWNKLNLWYSVDGVRKAWDKKTGNSTEINLILYHLLKLASLNPYLMELSTRRNGKLVIGYPSLSQLNKTVVYIPVDSAKYYVLDASDKYNVYNRIPMDLIGLYALSIDVDNKKYQMFPLKNGTAREVTLLNGIITKEGKLKGTSQKSSFSYNREVYLKSYNDLGEKKYSDEIEAENNGLKISSIKFENKENDTLPLIETLTFTYDLTEPDGDYMYFTPNLLTGIGKNPFTSETRVSNIDFGYLNNYPIVVRFKVPEGYKTEALPKSVSMQMSGKDISFKRILAEQDGDIIVRYFIDFKRSIFNAEEYATIREFYKKMYELLNEQIVLKKSG